MNLLRSIFLFTLIVLVFVGCYDDPDFGDTPRLTDIDVYTKSTPNSLDSLVVRVGFEDGDGDLGIVGNEEEPFFREPNSKANTPYWIYDANDPDLPPYDCDNYTYATLTPNDTIKDTLYVKFNEAYFNFSVTLFTKVDGQYQKENLGGEPFCGTALGGRFSLLKDDPDNDSPLKGVLQWGTVGSYGTQYKNDTLRIDVVMRDRAGNVSNVITFDEFTIDNIRRPSEEG